MITETERLKVYDVMIANGPDVDMWSAKFGRLVGQAKKAGVLNSPRQLESWLNKKGMFGPKSDALRADADKYY